ncbi:MAG: hypothetical protein OXU22_01455, partial [Gammaproteobacteria bacterium]|nr:hypothetical protein [Gammaproteobacteria bacterium]
TFLYDEPTSFDWTVRSRGQGATALLETNEDAQPIPNPNTADPGENPQPGENRDGTPASGDAAELAEDWMYFRFTALGSDSDTEYPERPVTVTYCLGGAARGGTPAQVAAAAPRIYDYTWPQARTHAGSSQTTYNPRATSPTAAGYDGGCVGRGSFTTGTGTWHNIYRLPIELNDDNVNEDDEIISAVIVHVASADGHARVPASGDERFFTAQRRIIDNDDAQGFVRFGPKTATANEGEDFTFTVRLSDTAPDQLRVPWTTSGLSGVAAVPGSGTAVFAPGGETTQEVTLRIDLASALGSSSPTQELTIGFDGDLAGPGAAAFQKAESANDLTVDGIEFSGTSTVTISFVDEPVQLSVTRLSVTEGDATGATYSVTLGSDPGAGETVTVTPTAPAGLTVTPASLTFDGSGGTSLWSTAQMFTVTAGEDDNGFDDSLVITHTVTTTQSSGDYAGFTDPLRVRVVVTDNDSRGVTVTPTTLSIPEGTQGFYTVRLTTEPVGGVVTVRLSDDDPDTTFTYAINTLVFTDSDGATPWDTLQTVAVDGVGEYSQSDSQIDHAVSGADYGGVGAASVRVIVTAASTAPTFSIALADSVTDADGDAGTGVQVGEDVGSVAFTVSVAGTLTADATVGWAASGGTINTAADLTGYPASGRTLTFTTADSAPKTITLNINEDNVNEATERLIVQLSNPAGGDNPLIAAGSASVQITDNDPIEFTVARATPASGGINEGDSQSFTVTAGGGIAGASVTVPWFISIDADAATANAMPADFRATAAAEDTSALTRYPRGMFTFTAAGAQTVTVHTLDDTANEPVEGFALYLGAPGGAAGVVEVSGAPAEVEIAASDVPGVTISTAKVSVEEGGTVQYTVVLDTEPTGDVMVTPATGAA